MPPLGWGRGGCRGGAPYSEEGGALWEGDGTRNGVQLAIPGTEGLNRGLNVK